MPRNATARNPGCTRTCLHIDPVGSWGHDVKLQEDAGEIHTDDCGFWACDHNHDPGECCTSGRPGVLCRVRITETRRGT